MYACIFASGKSDNAGVGMYACIFASDKSDNAGVRMYACISFSGKSDNAGVRARMATLAHVCMHVFLNWQE